MPYKNIVFVKLLVELLNDNRWTHQCNSNQKLMYLGLLLLAGITNNKVPNDPKWIKWRLNLDLPIEIVEQDAIHISSIFDKVLMDKEFISFSNFEYVHGFKIERNRNPILDTDKIRLDKDKIREDKKDVLSDQQRKKVHKDTQQLIKTITNKVV